MLTLSEILRKYYVKKYNFESEWQDIIINLSFQSMFIFEEFEKLLKKLNKHAIKREEVKENCKENEIVFDRML